jgi:hypothetical protein
VIFAALLLIAVLLAIPVQPERVLGIEFLVLMVCGVDWADIVLVPVICAAILGGLASAWLLLTKLTD